MYELLANPAPTGAGGWITFAPLIVMVVLFYFLLIRPQQKRTKTRNMMLGNLKKGDKVITIGGLHGTIMEITDDVVVLRVNDASKMTFDRSAVNTVVSSSSETAAS
jgi:preprotein translocase subunit YajC